MKNNLQKLNNKAMTIFSSFNSAPESATLTHVSQLVEEIKGSLHTPRHPLNIWATTELVASEQALDAGFPQIALMSAIKALEISQLSPKEYSYAFDILLHEQEHAIKQREFLSDSVMLSDAGAAEILLAAQEDAAITTAWIQEIKAAELEQIQSDMAAELLEENLTETMRMAAISAGEVQNFAERECQRNLYQQELEDILSWALGAYSVPTMPLEMNVQSMYEAMIGERELTATRLSEQQEAKARELKAQQDNVASKLREHEAQAAQRLKDKNDRRIIQMNEKKTVKEIHDKTFTEDAARRMMM